jgi:predicted glycosyltransferase
MTKPQVCNGVQQAFARIRLDADYSIDQRTHSNTLISKSKTRSISVMTYSHDGFGLGHTRRNYVIASCGVKTLANAQFLMMTGCSFPPFHSRPYGMDFIKLPSIIKVATGAWRARTLPTHFEQFRNLRATLIQDAARIFRPDILLVDYAPTGVWGELVPTLEMLKKRADAPKIILGLRDIMDAPRLTRDIWQSEGAYDVLRNYYDKIFIYGAEDVFNTAYHYGLNNGLADKVCYCGYLSSKPRLNAQGTMRNKLGVTHEKLILITGGGGYDAFPLMDLSLRALGKVFEKVSAEAILITGPLMALDKRKELEARAEGMPARIMKSYDVTDCMESADLVITMAGYNTLMDSIYSRKNTIVIPRNGPSIEQRMRAEIFGRLNLVTALKPAEQVTPQEVADVITNKLNDPTIPTFNLRLDGLTRVISEIESLACKNNRKLTLSFEPCPSQLPVSMKMSG